MLLEQAIGAEAFEAMRNDPVMFVRAFDREPWDYQADDLRAVLARNAYGRFEKPVAVVSMPRQNGKSTLAAWVALWRAYVDEVATGDVVVVALDREGAKIIFGDVLRIVRGSVVLSGLIDPDFGLTRNELRLKDGRRIIVRPAESARSRGLRISTICYDEMGWSSSADLFEALSAAMAAQADPLTLVVSTVGAVQVGPLWMLFEAAARGDSNVRLIYRRENLSPLISEAYLEQQRALLPDFVFMREHGNVWGSADATFATEEDWRAATSEGDPTRYRSVERPGFGFVDLGWVHDITSIAVAEQAVDGKAEVVWLQTLKGSQAKPVQFDAVKDVIVDLVDRYRIKRFQIEAPQGVALAQQVEKELQFSGCRVEVHAPTLAANMERWGALYKHLKDASIRLPPDRDLRRELLTLLIESRAQGWRVQDAPGVHRDRSVAVAGAVFLVDIEETTARPGGAFLQGGMLGRVTNARGEDRTAAIVEMRRRKEAQRERWKTPEGMSETTVTTSRSVLKSIDPSRWVRIRQLHASDPIVWNPRRLLQHFFRASEGGTDLSVVHTVLAFHTKEDWLERREIVRLSYEELRASKS